MAKKVIKTTVTFTSEVPEDFAQAIESQGAERMAAVFTETLVDHLAEDSALKGFTIEGYSDIVDEAVTEGENEDGEE